MKKQYTRIERIAYYFNIVNDAYLGKKIDAKDVEYAMKRLNALTSQSYTEWEQKSAGKELLKKAASNK